MSNSKNVDAFTRLIGVCTGYGGDYSPGSPNLRVEQMSDLLEKAREAILQVSIAKTGYETASNQREVAFRQMRRLVTQIFTEIKSMGVLEQTIADARTMVRKIKGYVKGDRPPVLSAAAEATVSRRQRVTGTDYASRADNFAKLLETLMAEQGYTPGLPALQVEALKQTLAGVHSHNAAVANALAVLAQARRDRDDLLYDSPTSVYNTARAVKLHIRTLYGHRGDATRAANRILFTKK